MNTPERHSRISDVFLAVCDLSAENQTTKLDQLCGDDRSLRAEIRDLLSQDSRYQPSIAHTFSHDEPTPYPARGDLKDRLDQVGTGSETGRELHSKPESDTFPKIPGYELIEIIGHGGMGIVYRARQVQLRRDVAIKILPSIFTSANPSIVERFKREAAAAAKLRHKNIVPVYDFGRCDECYYYAMQLVEGIPLSLLVESLARRALGAKGEHTSASTEHRTRTDQGVAHDLPFLSYDELPFRRRYFQLIARWMGDVADALQLAHEHGLIHRDIKPGNLLVSQDGEIMIADFGLVMSDQDATLTKIGSVMGTLRFLSPEQALGHRVPMDHRTDIYALGATIYELLTLRPMFEAEDDKQMLAAVLGGEPTAPRKLNPAVPLDLETICLKAIQKRPSARYASARDLADDLQAFLRGTSISARPPSFILRARRFADRHRVGLLAGTAIGLSLMLALILANGRSAARRQEELTSLITQGLVQQQDHQWAAAAETYHDALGLDPNNVRALGNLAIVCKEQFNAQQQPDFQLMWNANEYCDRALDVAPDNAGLWNLKGVILKMLGAFDDAAAAYAEAIAIPDAAPQMRIAALDNLSEIQWLVGDYDVAERTLRQAAVVANETGTPAWFVWQDLASLEVSRKEPACLEHIQRGFSEKSEPGWRLYVVRARVFLDIAGLRDVKQAVRDAYAALDQNQPDPRVERTAALAMLRDKDFENAVRHASNALALGDVASFSHLILAIAYGEMGQFDQAAAHLSLGTELWPTDITEDGYRVSTDRGMLWFDTFEDLLNLKEEAEHLIP